MRSCILCRGKNPCTEKSPHLTTENTIDTFVLLGRIAGAVFIFCSSPSLPREQGALRAAREGRRWAPLPAWAAAPRPGAGRLPPRAPAHEAGGARIPPPGAAPARERVRSPPGREGRRAGAARGPARPWRGEGARAARPPWPRRRAAARRRPSRPGSCSRPAGTGTWSGSSGWCGPRTWTAGTRRAGSPARCTSPQVPGQGEPGGSAASPGRRAGPRGSAGPPGPRRSGRAQRRGPSAPPAPEHRPRPEALPGLGAEPVSPTRRGQRAVQLCLLAYFIFLFFPFFLKNKPHLALRTHLEWGFCCSCSDTWALTGTHVPRTVLMDFSGPVHFWNWTPEGVCQTTAFLSFLRSYLWQMDFVNSGRK